MQKLNLKVEKAQKFIGFLKRFSSIENSLLLEIDTNAVKAKSHTPEKSVVKYSSLPLDEVFSEYTDVTAPVKLGILNIDKISSSLKFFDESEFDFIIDYEVVSGENVATSVTIQNKSLEISFQCASLKLFTYITDDILDKITSTADSKVDFVLPKESQAKISSLFGIDSDHSRITFNKKGDKVAAEGKNFKLDVVDSGIDGADDIKLSVFKHHYAFLDREDAIVYIADEKLIFVSNESDTKMIVGEAE